MTAKRLILPAVLVPQAFLFNERKDNDTGRFAKALRGVVGKGLRYAKLIGGEGIHRPETWQSA